MVNRAGAQPAAGRNRFKGVRMRSWGKWVSEVRLPHTRARLWLGSYSTPEQAARAYDVAVRCLRGASASLNFPDSQTAFAPPGASNHQIRKLAAAAACAVEVSSSSPSSSGFSTTSLPSSPSLTDLSSSSPPLSSLVAKVSSQCHSLKHQLSFTAHTSCQRSSHICLPEDQQVSPDSLPFPSLIRSSSCSDNTSRKTQHLSSTQLCHNSTSPEAEGLSSTELPVSRKTQHLSSTQLCHNGSSPEAEGLSSTGFPVGSSVFTSLLDGTFDVLPWQLDVSEWNEVTMYGSIVPMEKLEDDLARDFEESLWGL